MNYIEEDFICFVENFIYIRQGNTPVFWHSPEYWETWDENINKFICY